MHTQLKKTGERLRSWTAALIAVAMSFALSGCTTPQFSRLPVAYPSHPQSEKRAFAIQDPLPVPDLGPELGLRPRDYDRPRNPARRAAELRLLHGIQSGPEGIRPGVPRGGLYRREAVR